MVSYSATKNKMPFAGKRMEPDLMLSKINQARSDEYCLFSS